MPWIGKNKCQARLASSVQEASAIGDYLCRKVPEHGAGEMVQLLMCLLHKHENPTSSPRSHTKKASIWLERGISG